MTVPKPGSPRLPALSINTPPIDSQQDRLIPLGDTSSPTPSSPQKAGANLQSVGGSGNTLKQELYKNLPGKKPQAKPAINKEIVEEPEFLERKAKMTTARQKRLDAWESNLNNDPAYQAALSKDPKEFMKAFSKTHMTTANKIMLALAEKAATDNGMLKIAECLFAQEKTDLKTDLTKEEVAMRNARYDDSDDSDDSDDEYAKFKPRSLSDFFFTNHCLETAAAHGNLDLLEKALKSKAFSRKTLNEHPEEHRGALRDVFKQKRNNREGTNEEQALQTALSLGNEKAAKLILNSGVDINFRSSYAMLNGKSGSSGIIHFFMDHHNNAGLAIALKLGADPESVREEVSQFENINRTETALEYAKRLDNNPAAIKLLEDAIEAKKEAAQKS